MFKTSKTPYPSDVNSLYHLLVHSRTHTFMWCPKNAYELLLARSLLFKLSVHWLCSNTVWWRALAVIGRARSRGSLPQRWPRRTGWERKWSSDNMLRRFLLIALHENIGNRPLNVCWRWGRRWRRSPRRTAAWGQSTAV